jgi:glycosyltransferase involved in cell wall biosynthesis
MRISIDATGLGRAKTGTAVYIEEILKAWADDPDFDDRVLVLATDYGRKHLQSLENRKNIVFTGAPVNRMARIAWQQTALPLLLRREKIDVHWGAGFVLPLLSSTPMVVTIFDLTFQILPDVHERVKRWYFPAMIKASVAKANRILAISQAAAGDLERLYPAAAGKIQTTLLAPRKFEIRGPAREPGGATHPAGLRFLFVGTIEPRKNLKRLIEAWIGIPPEQRAGAELRIVGATGWMVRELVESGKNLEGVSWLGPVSDSELALEYSRAQVFAYPSLYEGFGLPVVEAMSMGLPVLTGNTGATREIATGAALLVDPWSVDSISGGLLRMISDSALRSSLAEAGLKRAGEMSWTATAAETLQAIRCAAGRHNVLVPHSSSK